MSSDLPVRIAWQGITQYIPQGWEPVGTYRSWKSGHILVAEGRSPRFAMTWQRNTMRPDLDRTLFTAARRQLKTLGAKAVAPAQAWGPDGSAVALVGGRADLLMAARYLPEAGLTLIWRQLEPWGGGLLRRITESASAVGPIDPVPWCMHGLDIELSQDWRSEGFHVLAGLVRAVWFRYRTPRSVDHVLVMRRYACASMVLGDHDLEAWLRSHLSDQEDATCEGLGPYQVSLSCDAPGRTLWRRFRGKREQRRLHAWIDPAADRMTVQETCGSGDPLTCLRREGLSPRCALPSPAEAMGMP